MEIFLMIRLGFGFEEKTAEVKCHFHYTNRIVLLQYLRKIGSRTYYIYQNQWVLKAQSQPSISTVSHLWIQPTPDHAVFIEK